MRRISRSTWVAGVALALMGCGTEPSTTSLQQSLEAGRALWISTGIKSYAFTMARTIGPTTVSVRIVVDNDIVTSRTNLATNAPLDDLLILQFPDLLTLFDVASAVVASKPDGITLTTDPQRGYVRSLVVDPVHSTIDDNYSLTVNAFTTTP